MNAPAPSGFVFHEYVANVENAFANYKFPCVRAADPTEFVSDYLDTVARWEVADYEHVCNAFPACYINVYQGTISPGPRDFEHDESKSIYSNIGELDFYLYVKASLFISNKFDPRPGPGRIDPDTWIRQLAFDVAAFVTRAGRFGSKVGLSQVTRVEEDRELRDQSNNLLCWTVNWQHTVSLGEPDWTGVCDEISIAAADVKRVNIDSEIITDAGDIRDPSVPGDIESWVMIGFPGFDMFVWGTGDTFIFGNHEFLGWVDFYE